MRGTIYCEHCGRLWAQCPEAQERDAAQWVARVARRGPIPGVPRRQATEHDARRPVNKADAISAGLFKLDGE